MSIVSLDFTRMLVGIAAGVALPGCSDSHETPRRATTVDAPSASPSVANPETAANCGRSRGQIRCARLDLATGKTEALTSAPAQQGLPTASCGEVLSLPEAKLTVVCDRGPDSAADPMRRPVTVYVDVSPAPASGKRVRLDAYSNYWDFIRVWAVGHDGGIDLAVDYGVRD